MKKTSNLTILGIETSCDETAAAVYDQRKGLLSNIVASQIDIHKRTGGVVPEVASRAHVEQIIPVIDEALEKAKIKPQDLDLIAVTYAPGLIGSLLVGVNTAKALAWAWDKALLPINHIEAHIYANFISNLKSQNSKLQLKAKNFRFPAVVLIVSGGHTSLVLMKDHGEYKTLGETLDDAAGEAFDKVAKILGLEYPGGPSIARAAEEHCKKFSILNSQFSNKSQILNPKSQTKLLITNYQLQFPRPMIDSGDFNFSFSGLKTAVLYKWQEISKNIRDNSQKLAIICEFCYEFQEAIVDVLVSKTIAAAKKYKAKTISICGGVAANKRLRDKLEERIQREVLNTKYLIPNTKYCTDNAAMVACCAAYKVINKTKKQQNRKTRFDFEVKSDKKL